jgi:hypothetical protein
MHHLRGYRLAAVRYILTPSGYAAAEPDYVPAGVPEPTSRIYQLDGSARYFGAAGCQVTSGDRDSAWIVCPRRTTLVRREAWFRGRR